MDSGVLAQIAREICTQKKLTFVRGVGEGAFKCTYEVKAGERPWALKLYKPDTSNMLHPRSQRELQALKACDHPNIARFAGFGDVALDGKDWFYAIEEFLPQGSLTERVAQGSMDRATLLTVGAQLIDAIAYIASLRFVHRDIKPDNIIFRDAQTPVLVDFGLVRILDDEPLTASWQLMGPGTALFAAPEQLNNQKSLIDWRTDQFGLGVTLGLCATGTHPFAGEQVGAIERMSRQLPPAASFLESISGASLWVLEKMLQPSIADRYEDPVALKQDWERMTRSIEASASVSGDSAGFAEPPETRPTEAMPVVEEGPRPLVKTSALRPTEDMPALGQAESAKGPEESSALGKTGDEEPLALRPTEAMPALGQAGDEVESPATRPTESMSALGQAELSAGPPPSTESPETRPTEVMPALDEADDERESPATRPTEAMPALAEDFASSDVTEPMLRQTEATPPGQPKKRLEESLALRPTEAMSALGQESPGDFPATRPTEAMPALVHQEPKKRLVESPALRPTEAMPALGQELSSGESLATRPTEAMPALASPGSEASDQGPERGSPAQDDLEAVEGASRESRANLSEQRQAAQSRRQASLREKPTEGVRLSLPLGEEAPVPERRSSVGFGVSTGQEEPVTKTEGLGSLRPPVQMAEGGGFQEVQKTSPLSIPWERLGEDYERLRKEEGFFFLEEIKEEQTIIQPGFRLSLFLPRRRAEPLLTLQVATRERVSLTSDARARCRVRLENNAGRILHEASLDPLSDGNEDVLFSPQGIRIKTLYNCDWSPEASIPRVMIYISKSRTAPVILSKGEEIESF